MAYPNIMTIRANSDSVLVNELNLPSGIIYKNVSFLRNVRCWHKFIVSNTDGLTREEILRTILDHVHPLDLIPVFFAKDPTNSNSYFMARNCEQAIDKLCKDNLVVEHPYNKKSASKNFRPFKINIILNFSNTNEVKIDVQKNVLQVLQKRISAKVLDLTKFYADEDLTEFCPLSQPKIMYFVLHIAKTLLPEELILTENDIKMLNPLDVLIGCKLRRIDLSNNQLTSLNDLANLKHFGVKELKLSGNPFCDCDEDTYISRIKSICPGVEMLDGVPISLGRFPAARKNFLCDVESFDLLNQFLEHFFTVYDSSDRRNLSGLYHPEAMFSMTTVYLAGQLSSSTAFLKAYSTLSRNLKKVTDFSKTTECLFRGRENIINLFATKLPPTEHDPFVFTADLSFKTNTCAVITVTGVFHEIPTTLLAQERLLGFTRTFVLEIKDNKCVIVNELYHLYNGLSHQERTSFLQPRVHSKMMVQINKEFLPKPQKNSDFMDMISTLGKITNLKEDWSEKCLEECDFDLKRALELFVDLYKADKIPKHAFVEYTNEYLCSDSESRNVPLKINTESKGFSNTHTDTIDLTKIETSEDQNDLVKVYAHPDTGLEVYENVAGSVTKNWKNTGRANPRNNRNCLVPVPRTFVSPFVIKEDR